MGSEEGKFMVFVASFWGWRGGKRTPYAAIFAASAFPHGTINVYPLCSVPSLPNKLTEVTDRFGGVE